MALTDQEEAAVRGIIAMYRTQAPSLSDDMAELAPGLYPEWDEDSHYYALGERVTSGGTLYVCIIPHVSQPDWDPADAPSLWARNLAAADSTEGDAPEWQQPDSTNGYAAGAIVSHGGKLWESLVDNNVWEPGVVGTESLWQEIE